jgi:DNA-binding CsgD family transcriptional regulator
MSEMSAEFDGLGFGSVTAGLVDGVANWCEALNGDVSLQAALVQLLRAVHADAGMIVRTHRSDFRPVAVATHDTRAVTAERPLKTSFADGLFGTVMQVPRTASLWLGSAQANEFDDGCNPALREWQASRGLKEFAVLVLASGPKVRDHIELHFSHRLSSEVVHVLSALLPTLVRTWAARQVGLVTRTVVNHRPSNRLPPANSGTLPILSSLNPARLSRAEFRVCLLLARGLSVAGVSEELKLSDATVRTHLRNIYAKANANSLSELVFLLMSSRVPSEQTDIRCA